MPEHAALLRIAEAISDGTPVDWEEELATHPELADQIRRLRLVEGLRSTHESARQAVVDLPRTETIHELDPSRLESWGSLRIDARLGAGAYGTVYKAYDPNVDRHVALKLRRSDRPQTRSDEQFLDEARALARVRHPNVLTVYGAGSHDGSVGLWTALIQGRTLEDILQSEGTFGAREAGTIGIDLCQALAAVHAAGLVHRDVKTNNIMREHGGRYVLLDFSAVTEREDDMGGYVVGTPHFLPPESFKGIDSGVAHDIFSLGVVLYRLASGRFPVMTDSADERQERWSKGQHTPLRDARPELPSALIQVIERAMAADPAERFPSAGEMEQALAQAIGQVAEPLVLEKVEKVDEPPPDRRWLRWAVAAVVVAGVALGLWLFGPWRPLEVEAQFFRVRNGVEIPLESGDDLKIGDQVFLEVRGSTDMYLYVLNGDDAGATYALFPMTGIATENPLTGDRVQVLPTSRDVGQNWLINSVAEAESFLVVASKHSLEWLEKELAEIPQPQETTGTFRGAGELTAPKTLRSAIVSVYARLRSDATNDQSLWFRKLDISASEPIPPGSE